MAVVSDRKVIKAVGRDTLYFADLVSATDYYAFGMVMADRSWNTEGYRYGFNGKENDNEVKGTGNQQDYGMRIYDARLGRFLSVDPLTQSFPFYTPYQFAGNKPINSIDLDGAEDIDYKQQMHKIVTGDATVKVTYYNYVDTEFWTDKNGKVTKSVQVNKTHIHVHVDGKFVTNILVSSGTTDIDGDGGPTNDQDIHQQGNPWGYNAMNDKFTVLSKDDENKGARVHDMNIVLLPDNDKRNSKDPKYVIINAVIGDKGYKEGKGGILLANHSSVEVSSNAAHDGKYQTSHCGNSKKGDCGGDATDKNRAVSLKFMATGIPANLKKPGKIRTSYTEDQYRFNLYIYSLAQIAINNSKGANGTSQTTANNTSVQVEKYNQENIKKQ